MRKVARDSGPAPRIILADEQLMLCEMVARVLQPEFDVIGAVHDGRTLIAAAKLKPDAVVLDVNLPIIGGAEVVGQILRVSPATRVVILTMIDDAVTARSVLDAGASGYVLKTAPLDELPLAIREVLRGHRWISTDMTSKLQTEAELPAAPPLTHREREVLALLLEGKPMREAGSILHITPRTIAFHKYRIMKKLQVRSSAELIRTAIVRSLAR